MASCSSPLGTAATVPRLERPLDELVQSVAVALLEGRTLGLPVIGEHDQLVGPRRVAAGPLDAPELLVELAERLERVGALEARVVGDLVVAREGRVDRRAPAHHVGEHAEDDQVADTTHSVARRNGYSAAVAARADVAPALPVIAASHSRTPPSRTAPAAA